jgi:uncharacterized membrane protein YphA (DoxX/SURF4 family)
MTGVKPKLTPFAAFGLALVMILAAVFHIVRGEYNFVPINLVQGGFATFIAYGRLLVGPIARAGRCALLGGVRRVLNAALRRQCLFWPEDAISVMTSG